MKYTNENFFKEESENMNFPLKKSELKKVLENAYDFRSGYAHILKKLDSSFEYKCFRQNQEVIRYNALDKNKVNNNTPAEVVDDLTELDKAMIDFEKMRNKIKKPLTDRAKKLILNELNKLASTEKEMIDILNQSIMNSWQGVFPLKEEKVKNENKYSSATKGALNWLNKQEE